MVRKSKEADREYMRLYMRDYRKEKRAEEEAQIEKLKLRYAEDILVYKYLSNSYKAEAVKPYMMKVHDVTGVAVTFGVTPSLRERIYKFTGAKITVPPSVPDNWAPHVTSVMDRAKKTSGPITVKVSEAIVIQDFKSLMAHDLNELINEEWLAHFNFLSDKWHKLPAGPERDEAIAEWKKMREEQKASEEALTDFIIKALVDRKTDSQIIRESQYKHETRQFYVNHFAPEYQAEKMIKEIRGYLPSLT